MATVNGIMKKNVENNAVAAKTASGLGVMIGLEQYLLQNEMV